MRAWHGAMDWKIQYILWFRDNVIPKHRPFLGEPMLDENLEYGGSFFSIAEKKSGGGYLQMEKRLQVSHTVLCGIDAVSRLLPHFLGRWYPFDALIAIPAGAGPIDADTVILKISEKLKINRDRLYYLSDNPSSIARFGVGDCLRQAATMLGDIHVVAQAFIDVLSEMQ